MQPDDLQGSDADSSCIQTSFLHLSWRKTWCEHLTVLQLRVNRDELARAKAAKAEAVTKTTAAVGQHTTKNPIPRP